jgi:hypothetical protein
MKIVLCSLSIAILGYFALQMLPARDGPPRLAANSTDIVDETSTAPRSVPRVRGHR